MDYTTMDCSIVKGLNCKDCRISSCTTSNMRTPVSKADAKEKEADMSKLIWDDDVGMYFIKRNDDHTCSFYDRNERKCSLPIENRFNSCLVYPVRVYRDRYDGIEKVILNVTCPSATNLFDLYARRDQSVVNYIKGAVQIFLWDHDYRNHVIEKTKDFKKVLRLGSITHFIF